MILNAQSLLVSFAVVFALGCNLPTAPPARSSLVASNSSAAAERRRAADPNYRLTPPCNTPAPLRSAAPQDRASGYIFRYRSGTDSNAVTGELASRLGFTPTAVYTVFPGFAAVVTEQALADIRCDPRVEDVEYDTIAHIAAH